MHLLPYVSIVLTASALNLPLQRRNPCEDVQDYESVYDDGPTFDGTAGIGAEFESPFFTFNYDGCSLDDTNAAKKEVVDGRKGTNWFLSADTGQGAGKLTAEYILDGVNIKVGSGDGEKAAKSVADDLINWKPWAGDGLNTVNIENNKCNPWRISSPNKNQDPKELPFFPQITAPMPLEALYSLMKENKADPIEKDVLDGTSVRFRRSLQLVKQDFFQSNTNGIDRSKVTDDVLAFCTLVLSYAKAATNTLKPDQSPKLFIVFMPRTEFNTLYQQVKSKLPGDLFTLFNSLACYNTDDKGAVVVDTAFCNGDVSKPISNNKFGDLSFTNTAPQPHATMNIKDWIEGIGKQSPSPDLLTKFDESVDSSIGGLGTKMEKMYQSQRSVPLIEFRDLDDIDMSRIENFLNRVDTSIQKHHKDFADAPKRKRDLPPECTMAIESAAAPTPTPTLNPIIVDPVDPPSQPSCVPSPTDSVKDAHEGELQKAAQYFCDQHATDTNAMAPIDIADTIIAGTKTIGRATVDMAYTYPPDLGNQDDVYDISLKSVPNCTPQHGFNLASPVAGTQCADILHSAWMKCNNQGRGGEITAGCLVYSVKTKY